MSNCNAAFLINNDNIWSDGCGHKLTAKILDKRDILGFIGLAIVGVQVSVRLFVRPSFRPSAYLPVRPTARPLIQPFFYRFCLTFWPCLRQSLHLSMLSFSGSVQGTVRPFARSSLFLSVSPPVRPSACPSFRLPVLAPVAACLC